MEPWKRAAKHIGRGCHIFTQQPSFSSATNFLDDLGQVSSPPWACFPIYKRKELSQGVSKLYLVLTPSAFVGSWPLPLSGGGEKSRGSERDRKGLPCCGGMAGGHLFYGETQAQNLAAVDCGQLSATTHKGQPSYLLPLPQPFTCSTEGAAGTCFSSVRKLGKRQDSGLFQALG